MGPGRRCQVPAAWHQIHRVPPAPSRSRLAKPSAGLAEWSGVGVAALKTINVQIFDQSYAIQGELDEAYVNRLARSVDEKMRAVAAAAGTVDTARVAVLTALNLADELEAFRQQRGDLRRRVERCVRLVETALRRPD